MPDGQDQAPGAPAPGPPAAGPADLTGRTLGDFQVLRKLGSGGMGRCTSPGSSP
jgi:hypothetical protein